MEAAELSAAPSWVSNAGPSPFDERTQLPQLRSPTKVAPLQLRALSPSAIIHVTKCCYPPKGPPPKAQY